MRTISMTDVNAAVKFVGNDLFIGEKKVIRQSITTDSKDQIPALYLIRYRDERGFLSLVTGLDLMPDGKVWLGGYDIQKGYDRISIPSAHYDSWDTICHILDKLCTDTIGKVWEVCEEEDFDKAWDDYNDCSLSETF